MRLRPRLAALLCFSPSLAALAQSVIVICGAAHAQKQIEIALPAAAASRTTATFVPGPLTNYLNVDLLHVGDSNIQGDNKGAADLIVLKAVQAEKQIPLRNTTGFGPSYLALLRVAKGIPCHFTVGIKENMPPAIAAQYRVQIRARTTDELGLTVGHLWFLSLILLAPCFWLLKWHRGVK